MNRYPALYFGLAMVSGIALSYGIWPPLFLIVFGFSRIQKWGFALIALFACIEALYFMPVRPKEKLSGVGCFQIEKVRESENSLGYYGTMKCFIAGDSTYYDLPVKFFRKELLPSSNNLIVNCTLKWNQVGPYTLLPINFQTVPYTKNLSHLRFHLKKQFRRFLKQHVSDDMCYSFFSALGTGEIDNRLLSLQFSKVGLTHTLAISGFHYSWLVFILGAFFHLFLSKRRTCYFLLGIVTLYFFFIGETPSLNRAWLAALIYLSGYLLKEPVSGLNSLGVALTVSLILDPHVISEISFQLSYLATFGILAIYPSLELWLRKIFPKRIKFKISFILSSFLRNTIGLTFAVNLATLPLVLYHFHYFPFLSIFFNLFFPLAITICMVALILSPIPLLGIPILHLAEWYTNPLLNMIFYGIDSLEGGIWSAKIPFDLLLAFLIAILLVGFWLEERRYHLTRIRQEL